MKVSKYESLLGKWLYVEDKAYPFVNVRMYKGSCEGHFDLFVIDPSSKAIDGVIELKLDLPIRAAMRQFKKLVKQYTDV